MLQKASLSCFISLILTACASNSVDSSSTSVPHGTPVTMTDGTQSDTDPCSSAYKLQVGPAGRKPDGQPIPVGESESQDDRQQRISNIALFANTAAEANSQMAYTYLLGRLSQGSATLPPLYSPAIQKDITAGCKNFASTESFQGMTGASYACLHKHCIASTNEQLRTRMKIYTDRAN